jgi:hypothetical protein
MYLQFVHEVNSCIVKKEALIQGRILTKDFTPPSPFEKNGLKRFVM